MTNTETKDLTYREILEALKKLSEEQLDQKAILLKENEHDTILSIEALGEDVYKNKHDDEDCATLEDLKELHGEDFVEEDYELVTPKGRVFMYANF